MKLSFETLLPKLAQLGREQGVERFVVAAILCKPNTQQVLCLKRAGHDFLPGLYELPSGKVDDGEDFLTALCREVREETHLSEIEVMDYLSAFDYQSRTGKRTRQLNFIVRCDNTSPLQLDEHEHEGYTWCSERELDGYNISQETKRVIRAYFLRQSLAESPTQQLMNGWEQGVQQFVVGGVITDHDKALILKRASDDFMGGIYELPSGKLEGGESIEMGIVREVAEETQLLVTGFGEKLSSFDYQSGSGKHTRQLNYHIHVDNTAGIRLSEEHEGFAWVTREELANYPISREVKAIIEGQLPKKSSRHSPKSPTSMASDSAMFSKKRARSPAPAIEQEEEHSTAQKRANFEESKSCK